jgi:hypothetical protein
MTRGRLRVVYITDKRLLCKFDSFREEFRKAFQAQDVGGTSGTSGGGGGTQSDDVDAATTKSGQ